MSVTEGSDKPAKYPGTFLTADWLALNKIDLLPYTDFNSAAAQADLDQIKPVYVFFRFPAVKGRRLVSLALAEAIEERIAAKRGMIEKDG